MNKAKTTALIACMCVFSAAHAVTINDGETVNAADESIRYLDTTEVTFSGTSTNPDTVGTLYFSSDSEISSRTGGRPDPENASYFAVAAGKTGRILVQDGALLTVKSGGKYFTAEQGATLFLQGNMNFATTGTAIGGDMYATATLAGDKIALLDNNGKASRFTVVGDLYIGGNGQGALSTLSIGAKSAFEVQQETVNGVMNNGLRLYGGTALELVGDIENGHVFFDTTNFYVGDLLNNKMEINVDSITGMDNGGSFILVSLSKDVRLNYSTVLDASRMDEVADSITFAGADAEFYSIAWDESGKNLIVTYAIPEPAEMACILGSAWPRTADANKFCRH